MRTRQLLAKMDRTLDRIDGHMVRGNELMEQIREEHRLNRETHEREHRLNRDQYRRLHDISLREHQLTRAAVENNTSVLKELLLQRHEDRKILERIEHGIAAQTEGLMRVLDELRGEGPQAAGA
jgi:hypothetical protein